MRAVYNPNRILYPMKRAGERGEGNWERISWDEAISTIASKWKSYREEFGPRSIAYYWGSGNCAALGSGNFGGLLGRLANVLEMTMVDYCTDMALGYGMARVAGDGMFRNGASLIKLSCGGATLSMLGGSIGGPLLMQWKREVRGLS